MSEREKNNNTIYRRQEIVYVYGSAKSYVLLLDPMPVFSQ